MFSLLVTIFAVVSMAHSNTGTTKTSLKSEIIFGPEWTFTNKEILSDNPLAVEKYLNRVEAVIREKFSSYPDKIVVAASQTGGFKITTSDGVWFEVGYDVGVLEVQSKPLSLKQWRQKAEFVQKLIFDSMYEAGLRPNEIEGAGHVNIGFSYFRKKPGLAKKFILDYLNNPGVGIALNGEAANDRDARSVYQFLDDNGLLTKSRTKQFLKTIDDLELETKIPKVSKSDQGFISYIRSKAAAIGLRGLRLIEISGTEFYELLADYCRFEMRQVRPQESFDSYLKILEIFQARIEFLEKIPGEIKLNIPRKITDGWEVLGQFADYIDETGLSWKDYRILLPKVWRKLPERNFVRKQTKIESINTCESLF